MAMARAWHDTNVRNVDRWLAIRNPPNATNKTNSHTRTNTTGTQSTVQTKLVRRQNEWRYPALSEPFLSSDGMFKAKPGSWEDVKSARLNGMVLNWQMRTKINAVKFIDEYVRTVVDEGTAIIRVGWEQTTKEVEEDVPIWEYRLNESEEHIQALSMALKLEQENPQGFEELPIELQKSAIYTRENEVPAMAVQTGTKRVVSTEIDQNRPTLDIVDYHNFYLDPSCNGDIEKANFAIVSFETSKAELIKDGRYKNLDKVVWSSQTPHHLPDHASQLDDATQFKDTLRKRVVAYEYWGNYDIDQTGVLKPIVATWIGNVMIRMEENPYPDRKLPFVLVPYLPVRRSATGEPDAELLEDNQRIHGALVRGMIDLMGKSANSQTAIPRGMLDAVNKQKYLRGEDYEYNPQGGHPAQSIYQHTFPEISTSAMALLNLQNQEAEALTGVKAFAGGLSGEAYGDVAAGVRGMLDAAGKREMSILRRLAQGMKEIGHKLIAMNQEFLSDEEFIEVTNEQYTKINRKDLKGQFNLDVDISTAEVDAAKAQDLAFMLQTMGNSLPFELTKKVLIEIARLKRMPDLAHQLENYKPEPDPVQQKMQELEVAKVEAEIQRIRSQSELDRAKVQSEIADARKANSEADMRDLDYVETETGTKHERQKDLQGAQAAANAELEITKRILNPKAAPDDDKMQDVRNAVGMRQVLPALTDQ
jgi:hypothetical protein